MTRMIPSSWKHSSPSFKGRRDLPRGHARGAADLPSRDDRDLSEITKIPERVRVTNRWHIEARNYGFQHILPDISDMQFEERAKGNREVFAVPTSRADTRLVLGVLYVGHYRSDLSWSEIKRERGTTARKEFAERPIKIVEPALTSR